MPQTGIRQLWLVIIRFKFNWIIYGLGKIMQFVDLYGFYVLRYKSFLTISSHDKYVRYIIYKTSISKISNWYPLSFFANTPFAEPSCKPSYCLLPMKTIDLLTNSRIFPGFGGFRIWRWPKPGRTSAD